MLHALGYMITGTTKTDRTHGFCHPEIADVAAYTALAYQTLGGSLSKVLMDVARETWLVVHGDTESFEKRYL